MSQQNNKQLAVVNFFGGPGCTKSTSAAGLFYHMKKQNQKVELINEWIKGEGVWEQRSQLFGEQDYIFAHQRRLLQRLVVHDIDYAITDSPILLSLFYMPKDFPQSFGPFVREMFNSYDNINIFIDRDPTLPYVQTGRNEDLDQAIAVDNRIRTYFVENNISCWHVTAGDCVVNTCLKIVEQHKQNKCGS